MASKTAYMWIRDGVLINRMHVNPVAFALSYWFNLEQEQKESVTIETLINFGFQKSGYSCLEKMRLFNTEHSPLLSNLEDAVANYNVLAATAGERCTYFDFAPQLLQKLSNEGCKNYITSALDQQIIDNWINSAQGKESENSIDEILGHRPGFNKGADHFKYVSEKVEGGRIFYIADAVSEISTGAKYSEQFNITTIGFAYHIDNNAVEQAYNLILELLTSTNGGTTTAQLPALDKSKINLPQSHEIVEALKNAGADAVVTGSSATIMANLAVKLQIFALG
ncbi:hypothetical protein KA183_21125 [bacterium]|nr:hypothetical protein [bacterium]